MQMQCSEMRHNKPMQICTHGLVWTDIVGAVSPVKLTTDRAASGFQAPTLALSCHPLLP